MSSANQIKSDIIEVISKIEDIDTLIQLHNQIVENSTSGHTFLEAVKTTRKDVTLEALIAEQNYKPINYKEFREKVDSLNWDESLEELIDSIK